MSVLDKKEKLAKIVADQRAIIDNAETEKRGTTADEDAKYDKFEAEYKSLDTSVKREEALEARQAQMDSQEGEPLKEGREDTAKETSEELRAKKSAAFEAYLRSGDKEIGEEHRSVLQSMKAAPESRAQGTTSGGIGGYTVDETMASEIEKALQFYGGARELAKIIKTGGGENMNFPQNNDTGNSAVIVGENVQVGEQDTVFTTKALGAYKYNSQLIRVPIELIQDSSFNIMSYIAEISGERMGRGTNTHFTVGTGTAQPEGFMVGATDSTVVTAAAGTITFDNLIDLEHSVDIAYRRKGAAFTFNDATLKLLKKVKDTDGQYIWSMGDVKTGAPNTIMGYKYVVNNDIAAPAAGVDSVAFGDFSKFLIRDVAGQRIVRLTERYADFDQVGFMIFSRHDSMVLDAGTNPIKYMTQGI